MAKEKVYNLAQEFKVSSEALVQMLRSMGIQVKSHMSTVDESLRDDIRKRFEQERAEIKKEYLRKKQKLTQAREDMIAKAREEQPPAPSPASAAPAPKAPAANKTAGARTGERGSLLRRSPHGEGAAPRRPQTGGGQSARRDYGSPPSSSGVFVAPSAPFSREGGGSPGSGGAQGGGGKGRGRKKEKKRPVRREVDEVQMRANIRKTLAQIGSGSERKKYRRERDGREEGGEVEAKKTLNVSEYVTANELANMMQVASSEVIAKCLELGMFVTINQRLDFETISLLADEFGFAAQLMEEYSVEDDMEEEQAREGEMLPRAPIVTVMGHVDHGKTSLLDYVRKANVIAGEAGGITQHIAAYEIKTKHGPVTFLDTPGHEAFTAMRARGSQITDVIVLVVAADSGVMPQTREAIDHARAANVPMVVAINKVDLPTTNIERVKSELAQYNVAVTDYGGQVSSVEISALTGQGMDKLLETLALETEILELKANPSGKAVGVVVESELDKGKGPIATVLVQRGTLRRGDAFVTGIHSGRVRELFDERGNTVEDAGPSQPVVVLGLSGTPQAGDSFRVVEEEKEARAISARRRLAQKERELRRINTVSLDHLYEQIKEGKVQSINLVIKGDVDGSVEALASSLEQLSTDEIKVRVIHKSVGAIKETDIMLAAASSALIIGFHLSPNTKIRELARQEGVDIRIYRVIYEAVDAVKKAMEGMLSPEIRESIVAQIEVRKVFKMSKGGYVAGCMVTSGTVTRGAKARLIRNDVEVVDTRIGSLKRNQDDAREVKNGFECGIVLERCQDYAESDRIEVYEETEHARKLA